MLALLPPPLRIVHETSGLLFVDKPPGIAFHAASALGDPGVLTILRAQRDEDERLYSVHRLDRVTSGLLMVAKSAEAARTVSTLLREGAIHKYYVALSARKPSKKMGKVSGDMERSRRGAWKLLRSAERPAVTSFSSFSVDVAASSATRDAPALRGFILKPQTGRTHQLRVACKCLGSPILGDALYANAQDAAAEERAYLHATALRVPAGHAALSGDAAAPIEVLCPPSEGAAFSTPAFRAAWDGWFGSVPQPGGGGVWFDGTPVASRLE